MCRPFAVMLKPVGSSCNMACSYCYYLNNEVSDRKKMTTDRLEKIIASYFASNPFEVNSFVWHGGEPTLAGLDFYKEAVQKALICPIGAVGSCTLYFGDADEHRDFAIQVCNEKLRFV